MRRSRARKRVDAPRSQSPAPQSAPSRGMLKCMILAIAVVPLTAFSLAIFTSGRESPASSSSSSLASAPSPAPIHAHAFSITPGPVAIPIAPDTQEFRIALVDLQDGKARFYEYPSRTAPGIRFFAVQTAAGAYEVALDGCASCYSAGQGYVQQGAYMVCRKCDRGTPLAQLGQPSGECHPLLIPRTVAAEHLVIQTKDLELAARRQLTSGSTSARTAVSRRRSRWMRPMPRPAAELRDRPLDCGVHLEQDPRWRTPDARPARLGTA